MIGLFLFLFIGRTAAVLLHEVGHALAALFIRNQVTKISLGRESNSPILSIWKIHLNEWLPDYGTIRIERKIEIGSTFECLLFYSGGVLLNLICFCVSFLVAIKTNSYILIAFSFFNLQQFLLNIRPIEAYCDGGFHSDGFYIRRAYENYKTNEDGNLSKLRR